jgi:hypothetical protein
MNRSAKGLLATSVFFLLLACLIAAVWSQRGGVRRIRADIIVINVDIGIPGISKMYEGRITNIGFLPVRVKRCDFLDDTLSAGAMVAYAVQRRDATLGNWETVVEIDKEIFCKPYPLGIVEAKLVDGWLWPGRSLGTGEEATAARGFKRGDIARFIIFTDAPGDYGSALATPQFTIDEEPDQGSVDLRLRH